MKLPKYCITLLIISALVYGAGFSSANDRLGGFSAGPYLLDVTADSATVAFHFDEPLSATVRLFDADRIKEFRSQGKSKSHFIKVTGLEAGLTYNYQVISDKGLVRTPEDDSSFQIRTACMEGETFSFVVYGDPRPGETETLRHHEDVIAQIILHEPAFSLVLGDMVDNGEEYQLWQEFFGVEAKLLRQCAIYTVMGDNDYADGKGFYADFFPKLQNGYYRFEWGGVQFFGLRAWDTRGRQPRKELDAESDQVKWLQTELAKEHVQKAPFRVVFIHDPVYICRGRSSETLQRVWAPIFQKYNVDVVFASWHMYERSRHDDVTYIISGGGGAELIWMPKDPAFPSQAEAQQHHFTRVDVNSDAMTIRAVATDDTILDSITLIPKSQDTETTKLIERAAKRLSKEILINNQTDLPELSLSLFSYDCSYCRKLLNHELPKLAKENNVALKVSYFDLGKEGTYDLLLNAGTEFGRQDADVPAVFIGRSVFGGESEIKTNLPAEIAAFLENPQQYREQMIVPFQQIHDTATMAEGTFNALTYGIVVGAGLLDGINPCAFTTIIFLISYLSFVGVSRRQMFYTGGMFTIAVFLTYLVIGLVFFNVLKLILQNRTIVIIVNSLLLVAVLALAAFSLVDFRRCLKGNVKDITLQLPQFLKDKIRGRVRDFAKNKVAMTGTSFILGVVIAGMELACTGQVYIPIVTMISEPRYRVAATFYLLLYNIAFILPLVAVFLLATFGVTSERMGDIFRRHIAAVKLGFAVLFVVMAVMIVYNLRWL